jgi:hypothetical protein
MEANWMKAIPSTTICNFFYFFFVLYGIIITLSVLGFVGIVLSPKLNKAISVPSSLGVALGVVIAATQMLFFYLICSRSLLEVVKTKEGFFVDATETCEEDEDVKEAFADMKKRAGSKPAWKRRT